MNASKNLRNLRNFIPYLWVIFMLLTLAFFFITLKIEMPYDKWLSENLPVWLAIFNYVVFGVCFIILAVPARSVRLNYIVGTGALLAALFFKTSYPKAPVINIIILFISVILFIAIKYHYRKQSRNS